jgi:uncharacterized protein with NAD-binding domain and iron-sulfur cluster
MGWYENAFRLMRECYAELGRDRDTFPIADWRDAFEPVPTAGLADRSGEDQWSVWQAALPAAEGLPGDPSKARQRWTIATYMTRTLQLLRTLLATLSSDAPDPAPGSAPEEPPWGAAIDLGRWLRYGEIAGLAALLQAVAALESVLGSAAAQPRNVIVGFVDAITRGARTEFEKRLEIEPDARRVWIIVDLTLATLRGLLRAGVATDPRGLDAIDEYDCREWLLLNGASRQSVDSGWLRALYDFGFSYEDGDVSRPRIAAGQGVRAMLRAFFTYRGAFFWRMNAGMGDIVFAPFYQVLARRGVRFEFFHRLDNVRLAPASALAQGETPHVEALEFSVQAEIAGGGEYRPLVDVDGLPCWPSQPDWSQLVDGERLRAEGRDFESHWDRRRAGAKTLRVTEDFDFVVLGIGLGAVPHVCGEIVARDPRWRAMLDHVKTVCTQAFQIWLDADMRELGWPHGPTVITGFTEPFDTWADMSHLLPREAWPAEPRSLAYFCSVLPEPEITGPEVDPLRESRERVRRDAIDFLERDVVHLWPLARAGGAFRWDLLSQPHGPKPGEAGPARFDSQFWTANVNPSDRYALSLPGSSAYRISPLDATYDNLTIAGDWTGCGFNAGCVEAAVISGRLAAHALSQAPPLEEIVGFDHP